MGGCKMSDEPVGFSLDFLAHDYTGIVGVPSTNVD